MTKEQIIIRLRNTKEVESLRKEFHQLTGGLISIDTLHQDDCKGCPANSLCGCVTKHPELLKRCQTDHKEARQNSRNKAIYSATCHAGAEHIMLPLHLNGEVAGYLRCGGMTSSDEGQTAKSPDSLTSIKSVSLDQTTEGNTLSDVQIEQLKSEIEEAVHQQQDKCKLDSTKLFLWLMNTAVLLDNKIAELATIGHKGYKALKTS